LPLRSLTLDQLTIDDEASFRHVEIYQKLKQAVLRSEHRFKIAGVGENSSWDRVLFLNLTFWSSSDEASVLCDDHIAPDVIAHTALHHLVGHALARGGRVATPSPTALLLAEAIASAFDLYLVGRLVRSAPDSEFIASQVPIMAEAAQQAGLDEKRFAALIEGVAAAPEKAFEDMRALLVDAGTALLACASAEDAQVALERFKSHRFAPLLHHFQLSNWILYARAYARTVKRDAQGNDAAVHEIDRSLRESPDSIAWIQQRWLS
jgi:hypothetical protein